jgi:2-dehydropantoate 2-reductase
MRMAVIGAGAMGSLFGGALAAAGQEVWLVDIWREHVEAIKSRGLLVEKQGQVRTIHVQATTDPREVGRADLLLLFTKYVHTEAALRDAQRLLGPATRVLTLQNGIGNVDLIAQFVPRERILFGLTTLTSDLKGPGHIEETFQGTGETYFWPASGEVDAAALQMEAAFREAGIAGGLSKDVSLHIWKKLVINACLNTLTAILRLRVGDLYAHPEGRRLCETVALEVAAVARAEGVPLPDETALAHLQEVATAAARHQPSMLVDVLRGRRTEIECLSGAVVRLAAKHGLPVPANAMIAGLIRTIETTYPAQVDR